MLRAVFFGFPARGHTVPSLPVVAELLRRGMQVDYYSTPQFQALVETSGARFIAYPDYCDTLSQPRDLDEHLVHSLQVTAQLLPQLLLDAAPVDLVLFDASALWGGLFARQRGVPAVASITTFALNRAMLQLLGASARRAPAGWDSCAPLLARLNKQYAANIRDHLDLMVPAADLKLVYTSRSFQPGGRYFDQSHLFLGPLLAQRAREGASVPASSVSPLAYVSLGTIFNQDQALLQRISAALSATGWQVLVSLGSATAQAAGQWPEHVEVRAFVDQIGVLAEARLFVTHGGMNSVSEALAQAVPMLVIPQGVDQHLVARQTASLGAALALERAAVTAEGLHTALTRLDNEYERFKAAATALQQGFTDVTSISSAVAQMLTLPCKEQV